ncbi:hypothetical protein G6K93_18500 [Agrobacterium rhizogenes]|uniref:hypothetical protein n=1 Tax=Rhizobium rhizogenes TaxID=359 RepID=UPI000A9FF800|nr:hypothetical protein [Rhizobium rhizogenes]NTG09287.1 hypothetical protein [Rhizobium rhizogenes]NTG29256.1 hypothetical protein [Rhizobium rhizogenes]NTG42880.1 hypothetical protein [Rhizobium rhizogenes]NTH14018.1 hypothetical protein [Rhizobium rhizogenes]NTI04013.1 hypothetical protein [Rhizobium rhizogenes]
MFGWTVDAKLAGGHVNFDMGYSDIFGGTVDRHDALLRLQTRQREVQLQLPRLWLFSAVFSRHGCPQATASGWSTASRFVHRRHAARLEEPAVNHP